MPGLAVRHYHNHKSLRLPIAYAVGIAGYGMGLVLSTFYDLPSGALIVWCLAVLAMVVYCFGPSKPRDTRTTFAD